VINKYIILLLILCSCNNIKVLNNVDEMKIVDSSESFSYTETRKEVIQKFKNVLEKNPEKINCEGSGTILFLESNEVKLKVNFSITPDCPFFILNNVSQKLGYRLNYQSRMYLSEYFYRLKKEK
jgi:hypothetical protein